MAEWSPIGGWLLIAGSTVPSKLIRTSNHNFSAGSTQASDWLTATLVYIIFVNEAMNYEKINSCVDVTLSTVAVL